jgi:dTDP-4-dehydrorhamnose 3,5-epimerase
MTLRSISPPLGQARATDYPEAMATIESLSDPDVLLITAKVHGDARGRFAETFSARELAEAASLVPSSRTTIRCRPLKGTVRGLHFQLPPHAQDKLLRVTRARCSTWPSISARLAHLWRRHVAVELSAENWRQLLVPRASPTASRPYRRLRGLSTR